MAGEAVTAMIVVADAGDNPLADRREDREALLFVCVLFVCVLHGMPRSRVTSSMVA